MAKLLGKAMEAARGVSGRGKATGGRRREPGRWCQGIQGAHCSTPLVHTTWEGKQSNSALGSGQAFLKLLGNKLKENVGRDSGPFARFVNPAQPSPSSAQKKSYLVVVCKLSAQWAVPMLSRASFQFHLPRTFPAS